MWFHILTLYRIVYNAACMHFNNIDIEVRLINAANASLYTGFTTYKTYTMLTCKAGY